MATEKILNTRVQLKYDSYANWTSTTLGDNKGANFVLKAGEIGICYLPTDYSEKQVVGSQPPQILFKVGNGSAKFSELPWASAKAADVYEWAKQASLPVTKVGNGNVVAGIEWDEASKGIKFTTASVATSEGMEQLANRVTAIENGYATDAELAAAVEAINTAIAAKADKTYVDEQLALKVNVSDFNTFKTENTTAIGTAKSEAIAAAKTETDTQIAGLRDGAVKTNADAIAAIKDHGSVDSFADVMTEMAKYQLSGDYATQTALAEEIARAQAAEKVNADAIERLTNGVSQEEIDGVNDLINYVNEHGAEVTGIKADIDALEGRMDTAEGAIATKAAQADLEALAGRVSTVEGDLNTESTGIKARMTQAEADIDALETKVGDKTVAEQIEAAIAEAKTDASNKDAVILAEAQKGIAAAQTALETEIAKKANDADLAAIAKTGSTDDLVQGEMVLVFDCGSSTV